jgi:FdhE protein
MLRLATAIEIVTRKDQPHKLRLPWTHSSKEPDAAAHRIRIVLEENRLDVGGLLPHIAAGESNQVFSAAKGLQVDHGLVWTLAQNALKPALRAWCKQLTPLAKGIPWHKGTCFVCGAAATLGELQENDQVKHLRCGSCGADWQFRRLQCMYCGNEDHKTQRYLYAESQREKMRVEVCDKCHGYLKVIAAFTPTPPEMLTIEDLATLHLDHIAQERGYARGADQ